MMVFTVRRDVGIPPILLSQTRLILILEQAMCDMDLLRLCSCSCVVARLRFLRLLHLCLSIRLCWYEVFLWFLLLMSILLKLLGVCNNS